MSVDGLQQLDHYVLVKSQERAEDLYNPGTYALQMAQAQILRKKGNVQGNFKWRFDVVVPVKPTILGEKLSVVQERMYRKDVTAQVQLRKGEMADDPVVTERTLIIFWTTIYIAWDGEVWSNPEEGWWDSIGRVPAGIQT